jgi:hypothetical protein
LEKRFLCLFWKEINFHWLFVSTLIEVKSLCLMLLVLG